MGAGMGEEGPRVYREVERGWVLSMMEWWVKSNWRGGRAIFERGRDRSIDS
jgi:hypothetical protein